MTALRDSVVSVTLEHVRVAYLDRSTAKQWNALRKDDEPAVFCGWFWLNRVNEGGPFKTRSAALRDAYYHCVLHQRTPSLRGTMIPSRKKKAQA